MVHWPVGLNEQRHVERKPSNGSCPRRITQDDGNVYRRCDACFDLRPKGRRSRAATALSLGRRIVHLMTSPYRHCNRTVVSIREVETPPAWLICRTPKERQTLMAAVPQTPDTGGRRHGTPHQERSSSQQNAGGIVFRTSGVVS